MRVILDTNVLLSALISPSGHPDIIYHAWLAKHFELITSTTQIEEIRRVSRYSRMKSLIPAHRVGEMINKMRKQIVLEHLLPLSKDIELNDSNDAFLCAMATTGEADYLVTGDGRAGLLQMKKITRTHIVTPATFCNDIL